MPVKSMIKRTLKIIAVITYSLFLVYLTFVFAGLYGMGMVPEKTHQIISALVYANVALGLAAIVLSFFPYPRWSFLIFGVQCLVFMGVVAAGSYLMPIEKEKNLQENYKKINTRILDQAEVIIECEKGYKVALSSPQKTNIDKIVATLYLVPPNLEDEPHQILTSVNGRSGDIFIKDSHSHLKSILPGCKNETMTFEDVVARLKSM